MNVNDMTDEQALREISKRLQAIKQFVSVLNPDNKSVTDMKFDTSRLETDIEQYKEKKGKETN